MRQLILLAPVLLALAGLAQAEVSPAVPPAGAAPAAAEAELPIAKPRKPAEVRAEQLDILFAKLYTSKGANTEGLVVKIWSLWSANDSPTAEVLLAQAARAMTDGAPAEALKILDSVIGANPDFAEAWNKRATLYFLMKRDEASLKDIAKVLDLEPRHFGALAGRGMIYQRQMKIGAALDAYRDALRINPGMEQVKESIKKLEKIEQGI